MKHRHLSSGSSLPGELVRLFNLPSLHDDVKSLAYFTILTRRCGDFGLFHHHYKATLRRWPVLLVTSRCRDIGIINLPSLQGDGVTFEHWALNVKQYFDY